MKKFSFRYRNILRGLRGNLFLKILSGLMAVTLWLYVVSEGLSKASIDVPIIFKNLPDNLSIVEYPDHVKISMEGPEVLLKNIHDENIRVLVDLSKAKPGSATVHISEKNVKVPSLFRIQSIQPQYFRVKIDKKMKKVVSIKQILKGQPASSFYIENIALSPNKIEIEGPTDIIKRTKYVKTVPIDIDGISENEEYMVALDIDSDLIVPSTKRITVSIKIGRKDE